MIRRIKWFVVAVLMVGCGGKEVNIRQDDGTWKPSLMTPSEEVTFRQDAIRTNVVYSGDCHDWDDNAYGNETVFYETVSNNTGNCTYFGGGGNTSWFLSFDDSMARYYNVNRSMNNNVRGYKFRTHGAGASRVVAHLNETFGGGILAEVKNYPADTQGFFSDPGPNPPTGSSWIMCVGCQ